MNRALVTPALVVAALSGAFSALAQAKGAPPPVKLPTPTQIEKATPRLVAPAALAATASVSTGEGPLDGNTCVPGLRYGKEGLRKGLTLLSTTAGYLKLLGVLGAFEAAALEGKAPGEEVPFALYCQEAAFYPVRNMGTLRLPPFDRASWAVGDIGQDECGDTTVVVFARRGTSYAFLTVPLVALDPPGFTCLRPVEIQSGWCERRNRCMSDYLAVPANRAHLEKKLASLTADLVFSR